MRIFILFLAMLAVWCGIVATANFMNGDQLWGWINAACVVINLGNMSFWLFVHTESK